MAYKVTLTDRAQRETRLRKSVDESIQAAEFYDYKNEKMMLKVVRVAVDLPVYRMENFRTFSAQADHLAREKLGNTYFTAGQENESVQQIQHDVLVNLARRGTTSVVPIRDVLKDEGQRENLLITIGGVVVNGNRRLAAMRDLYSEDPTKFASFGHVNCMVLPADASAADILDIEGRLQARPETRLDYDWIGDAQLLRALMRVHTNVDGVARVLGRTKSEVRNTIQALFEADLYLTDWVKAPNEYSRVAEDGKQLFNDLAQQVQGLPNTLQDGCRAIAWTLFTNRRKLTGRVYNYNVVFGKRAESVLDQLAEQLGVVADVDAAGETEDFEFDIGDAATVVDYQRVANALRPENATAEAVDALVAISENAIEAEREKKTGSAALRAVSAAHAKLSEVDLSRAAPDSLPAIGKQLESIATIVEALRHALTKLNQSRVQTEAAGD